MRKVWTALAIWGFCSTASAAWALSVERAALILAFEDERRVGPELLGLLADPDPATRSRAALAVGRIGRAADVAALTPLLRDPDGLVRQNAVFAMGEIEDSTAASALARVLVEGDKKDVEVRSLAVEGLGKLRAEAEACRSALMDASPKVRARALLAAWQIPVPNCIGTVLQLSRDEDTEVHWTAAYCLMRMAGAPASGRTPIAGGVELSDQERNDVGVRLRQLSADGDPRVRLQAARGLRSFGDTLSTRALLNLQRDADHRARVEAVRALGAALPSGQARAVTLDDLRPFLADPNPNVKVSAIEALTRIGPTGPAEALLESFLADPRSRMREVALQALVDRRRAEPAKAGATRPDLLGVAKRFAASKDWTLRVTVAEIASVLSDAEARPLLEAMLADEPRVSKAAIEPYLRLRARTQGGPLLDRAGAEGAKLSDAQDPILRALFISGWAAALSDSSSLAKDADWDLFVGLLDRMSRISARVDTANDVRLAAIEALAGHTDRSAAQDLLKLLSEDRDYVVRREAIRAAHTAGMPITREPEPVATERTPEQYQSILAWADAPHWAVIETEGGRIVLSLFSKDAPLTCWNFAHLADSGFYDQGNWHRVVPDFVLQDGCPRGDGFGGPDWQIRCEINRHRYTTGALGMALSGKDTGGSQFFITHSDQPHLDGRYTVFGEVLEGMEVANLISQGSPIFSIRVLDQAP